MSNPTPDYDEQDLRDMERAEGEGMVWFSYLIEKVEETVIRIFDPKPVE
jgi:hypothetical protein